MKVKAFAPATVANLGVGFDVLGLSLDSPGDFVTVESSVEQGVTIVEITGDNGRLPREATKNSAAVAAQWVLDHAGAKEGVRLWLEKGLPLASGMGSSAASAVAAAVAVNELLGEPFAREDLLPAALEGEAMVSGRHADNVAPALLGGITLITGTTLAEIHRLPLPDGIYLSLVTPHIEVPTAEARALLPKTVPLNVMVHQTGVVAELVHALHSNNLLLLARAIQRDTVVEPVRSTLIPHIETARDIAIQSGALALMISGAGPSLCSLCLTAQDAEAVSKAIVGVYEKVGIGATGRQAVPSMQGAYVVRD